MKLSSGEKLTSPLVKRGTAEHIKEHALFFLAWGLWIVVLVVKDTYGFPHDSLSMTAKLVTHIPFLLLAGYEISKLERYGFKDILFLLVVILALASSIISSDKLFLKMILFIYCARRIDIKVLLVFTSWILAFACIGVVLGAFLGVVEMHIVDAGGSRPRNCLGFEWANRPLDYLLAATSMYVAGKGANARAVVLLVIGALAVGLFAVTNARTPFGLLLLLLAGVFIIKLFSFTIQEFGARALLVTLSILCPIAVISLCLVYDPNVSWMNDLNNIMSNRLLQSNKSLTLRGISLLGTQPIASGGTLRVYQDSAYLQLLTNYGAIIFALVVGVMAVALERACVSNDRYMALCLLLFSIWAMVEEAYIHLQLNPFLFLIGGVVFELCRKHGKKPEYLLIY